MRKYHLFSGVLITSLIFSTGFKNNTGLRRIFLEKPAKTKDGAVVSLEPVKVSIANATVIQGDKGQRPLKVMVYLSRAATEPVTVKYSTKNGSAKAGVDYVATNGSITFQPGEAAKW